MIWVQCVLASQRATTRDRPYKNRCSVGATFMVALARTANGTQTKTEVNA
jgi:hypothetical protein